jgi:hypothetical protein
MSNPMRFMQIARKIFQSLCLPVPADVAFFEYSRAIQLTRDQRLRSRRNEEPIDDARELVAAHKQPRPAQRHAVGHDLPLQVLGICGCRCALGRSHSIYSRP